MNIVITMAGAGSRFKNAGYSQPKYQIIAKGKSLFEWSMESLEGFNKQDTKYTFIVQKQDDAKEFIISKMKKYNVKVTVIEIDKQTDGQATTAMLASKHWNKEEELIIYNIDTYIEKNEMNYKQIKGDGFIPCFKGEGNHWSFVKLNEKGQAIEVREKNRISEECTVGLYYFKTCKLYENLYNEYYTEDNNITEKNSTYEKKEKYIAPLYNYLIQKNGEVYISNIPVSKVHVLGTPEELQEFINQ